MTKLDYSKASEPDPARVVEVRDSGVWSGNDERPFETEAQRRTRRVKEKAALFGRSEKIRYGAIIKKFGEQRAMEIGVPREFIEARRIAIARTQKRQERAQQKRALRASKTSKGL